MNLMVWCYSLIVGEVSVIYLAMVPDCKDIINVSPPYALFCCCPVEQVLLHSSAMNRLAHSEAMHSCVHGCSLDPQVVDSIKYKIAESHHLLHHLH